MVLNPEPRVPLAPLPARGPGWFSIALPPGAAGQWCRVSVTLHAACPWWSRLLAEDHARGQVVREAFLGPLCGPGAATRTLLMHVPHFADRLLLNVITLCEPAVPAASLQVLGRTQAALRLVAQGWRMLPRALRGQPAGLPGRIRTELGQAASRRGQPPGYDIWLALHDCWTQAERHALSARFAPAEAPAIEVLLTGGHTSIPPDLLAAQWLQPVRASVYQPGWARLPGAWLLVLDAGERLAPHALACFALAIHNNQAARGLYADVDVDAPSGRQAPLFKPHADACLLASGLLASGACVFAPGIVLSPEGADPMHLRQLLAETIPPAQLVHVPFILTHLPHAPRAMARKTAACLPELPFITLVIPSACRRWHVLRCLRRLLAITEPGGFDILVAVTRIDSQDRRQAAILKRLRRLPHVRVLDMRQAAFNYAAVNNAAVREAKGAFLLLLNDDVVPVRADWLRRMAAFAAPASDCPADIVGARLLYGNQRVQHGGVIMGLAHLCENAFRLTDRNDCGPHGIARMNRHVSAVTAACMLVRRSMWDRLDGMDTSFAIALNDVDFCLRAGQAGARIVFAADVELYHYESLSLGRHYAGARAGLEAREVLLLRARWQSLIADDPFYNPNASIEPGREFQPAFPPRLTPLSWIAGDVPALR